MDFSAVPPRGVDTIVQAVKEGAAGGGRVLRVMYLDEQGEAVGEWHSKQLPENPFQGQMQGLQEPPYRLEQLVFLAEQHPVHSAALEQKTADICGKGWEWSPLEDDQEPPPEAKQEIAAWFEGLSPDDVDMRELISAVWNDVETTGWGTIEAVRSGDANTEVKRLYHVPAHTVRAHRNGFALCQIRDQRKVWFKRWGATTVSGGEVQVDAKTGSLTRVNDVASEILVIKKPSRRSSWYGIPGYISAIGWITLALAARDDNLFLFQNRREPRWAIVLTNLADDPLLQEDLRRAFQVDLKQPHRNILVPITGPGKIEFQKLSADIKQDGSFDILSSRADKAILVAHRVPAERLANSEVGPLGGNRTDAASRVYKEGVVTAGQEILDSRLNNFIRVEFELATSSKPVFALKMDDLDIETDREELDLTVIAFHGDLITLGEARHRLKMEPLKKVVHAAPEQTDPVTGLAIPGTGGITETNPETGALYEEGDEIDSPYNDMLFSELPGTSAATGNVGTPPVGAGGLLHNARGNEDEIGRAQALDTLQEDVRVLLRSSRETVEALDELTKAAREPRRGD